MSLTQLNIRYDPEYPFDWVACEPPELGKPKPRFPYRGFGENGVISVLGLDFDHRHVVTGGFDPYAGDIWTIRIGPVELGLTDVVSLGAKLSWSIGGWSAIPWKIREMLRQDGVKTWGSWEAYWLDWRDVPWVLRRLWAFLETRKAWYDCNVPCCEDYPHYCE